MAEQLAPSHPESARPRPPQSARTGTTPGAQHGTRRSPRIGRGRGDTGGTPQPQRRGGPVARPQAGWVLTGLPLFGAGVDEVLGSPLGLVFTLCTVLGSAWAALLSTRRGLWWVLPMPPLVVTAVTVVTQLALHGDQLAGGRSAATAALKWAVTDFPISASAILAALAALGLRRLLALRSARLPRPDGGVAPRPVRPRDGSLPSAVGNGAPAPTPAATAARGTGARGTDTAAPAPDPQHVPVPRRSNHG